MSRPTPISGFPELLPAERNAELAVIDQLRTTFELHGYASIETRVAEPLDRLVKGGEIDKEVYVLRRLQADEDDPSDTGLALHYDLTVPFARYVLENAGKLEFPFRRYQIQKAWRGERPQEGRFREFTQADVDVVMKYELPFHFEVEVARVMADALSGLPLPPLRMRINNRKLIQGFYRGIGISDPTAAIRLMDKLDKLSEADVADQLRSTLELTNDQVDQCFELARISTADTSFVEQVRRLGVEHELLETGLAELAAVVEGSAGFVTEQFTVEASLSLARGLDYYTGTVFELYMQGYEFLKSVGGGGRYDALASDGKTSYPGVGISFGISRTLVPLINRGVVSGSRSVPSAVLVALPDEESRAGCDAIATRLRRRGIACEVAPSPQKYGRQIRFAERRGIPFVWFPGGDDKPHEVKDIRSGEQVEADPDDWSPPPTDLRPQVLSRQVAEQQENSKEQDA